MCGGKRKSTTINLKEYSGYAVVIGTVHLPSTLYLFYPISKDEFINFKAEGNINLDKRILLNIHLEQRTTNNKLNKFYKEINLKNGFCGISTEDTNKKYAVIYINFRNYKIYSGNQVINHSVQLNECKSYLLSETDSSYFEIMRNR